MRLFHVLVLSTVLSAISNGSVGYGSVGYAQTETVTEAPAEEGAEAAPAEETPAAIQIDPQSGERFRETRPDEPMRRGRISVAPWVVYVVGGCVVLLALALLGRRARPRTARAREQK